ncbi:MAG TPA: universal stress protein [Gemmataceae bacterium]|nr:universal stress protein [Gemmataceae bacterium]
MLAIQTILYPTNFSREAAAGFDVACALAREGRARVVVLHVERSPLATLGGTAGVPPLPSEFERERLQEQLNSIKAPEAGILIEYRLEYGEPEAVLLAVAKEIGADLIVMGTHGRTGLRRWLMGSVAEHIVRRASCPVLTVRTPVEMLASSNAVGQEKVST